MKIVVCVKQVPDSAAKVVAENGKVTWGDAPLVINPWDEFAVEAALLQQETHGGEVIALTIGGESAKEALKHALAMGCGQAILVSDPALAGSDSQAVAKVLAAALRKIGDVDLAFFGKQAIDGDMGVTAAQTARVLGWPVLSLVSVIQALDPGGRSIRVSRATEEGRQVVEAKFPAGAQRWQGYCRAALPILYGHPQGLAGRHPYLVAGRPGHPGACFGRKMAGADQSAGA